MTSTKVERETAGLDQPIPEVDAELATGRRGPGGGRGEDRHDAFLAVLRGMLHGQERPATPPVGAADPSSLEEQRVPEETLGDCLPGLASAGASRRVRRGRRRPPSRSHRAIKVAAAVALLGACAALPWAVPAVPGHLADLVPGHDAPVKVEDPAVSPPTDAFVGPVGVSQVAGPYDGVRLEAAGVPREVVVPRLHVDSTVVPISGQSGSLLPPSDPQVLGWWQEGRVAGAQYGSAVVTGHTVHTGGGALDHLGRLVVGDSVRVRTDHGWIRYVVQRARIYSKAELADQAASIFRLGGTGRLVLITCDDWNGSSYESNAVVFATPVDDQPS